METKQLKERFDELLAAYKLLQEIDRLYGKAVESGALDIAAEKDEGYRMAKVVWYAILLKLQQDAQPSYPDNRKEAENLTLFL